MIARRTSGSSSTASRARRWGRASPEPVSASAAAASARTSFTACSRSGVSDDTALAPPTLPSESAAARRYQVCAPNVTGAARTQGSPTRLVTRSQVPATQRNPSAQSRSTVHPGGGVDAGSSAQPKSAAAITHVENSETEIVQRRKPTPRAPSGAQYKRYNGGAQEGA